MPLRRPPSLVLMMLSAVAVFGMGSPTLERITATTPRLRCELEKLSDVSPFFSRLTARVAKSRGEVVIRSGPCPNTAARDLPGCLVHHLYGLTTRPVAIIFVQDSLDQIRVASTLGHEFQHAVELLEAPDVHSDDQIFALFLRIGIRQSLATNPRLLETIAAIQAGDRVGDDARKHRNRLTECGGS